MNPNFVYIYRKKNYTDKQPSRQYTSENYEDFSIPPPSSSLYSYPQSNYIVPSQYFQSGASSTNDISKGNVPGPSSKDKALIDSKYIRNQPVGYDNANFKFEKGEAYHSIVC